MKRFLYELTESWRIAVAQMRSNMTRSALTALGVIIGIIAVTLMGTAVTGISIGFDNSMSVLGDDVLYVTQWPWKQVDDWWNYRDRKKIKTGYTRDAESDDCTDAEFKSGRSSPDFEFVSFHQIWWQFRGQRFRPGYNYENFIVTSTIDCKEGRFFSDTESRGGANVVVIGYDVADNL